MSEPLDELDALMQKYGGQSIGQMQRSIINQEKTILEHILACPKCMTAYLGIINHGLSGPLEKVILGGIVDTMKELAESEEIERRERENKK